MYGGGCKMDKSIESELKDLISSKLKEIKEQTGKTLEEMADEVSLEFSVFYNLYNGVHAPRLTTLFKISRVYDLPIDFWFSKFSKLTDKTNVRKNAKHSSLVNIYKKLDNTSQDLVLDMLKGLVKRRKRKG